MRTVLLLAVLLLAAGSAEACLPAQSAQRDRPQLTEQRVGGRVLLQDRPLPGTVVPMPDMASPIRGQHGGMLA
jgi:hypothetical protein